MPAKPFRPPRPISSSNDAPARVSNTSTTNKSARPSFLQDVSSSLLSDSTPVDEVTQADPSNTNPNSTRQQTSHVALDMSDSDVDADADDESANNGSTKPPAPPSEQGPAPIPPKLLSRILHDSFKHPETKITKEAFSALQKYMEMFMREAMYRAIAERVERAETENQRGKSLASLFLDVEDLERLTPQLLADFCFV